TKEMSYDEVMRLPRPARKPPKKPGFLIRTLVRAAASSDLRDASFSYTVEEGLKPGAEPSLILMNHSSFIDLEIVSRIFYPHPYGIVCTSDGFVGKAGLMRALGCVETAKFSSDVGLIRDMETLLRKKTSVLMYPEASYSFDGCATPLPRRMGLLLKRLNVPVIGVKTDGAFLRDPLYNELQKRKVAVSAHVSRLFSAEEIREKSVADLDRRLDEFFTFDAFADQKKNRVAVSEPFRADGLERILYRCACCGNEGGMKGKGTELFCSFCGKTYRMDEYGEFSAESGETEYPHIPDWYRAEREEVREELLRGEYRMETRVRIGMMVDRKAIYFVGEGVLVHDTDGFRLTGCGGKLSYEQGPLFSYGLYADYFWYEIGDVIALGGRDCVYYCFPLEPVSVAKTRLAAEELNKIRKSERTRRRKNDAGNDADRTAEAL
ncbi:MAG: hypothetical protein IKX85_00620, partial [Clostridia bacterium]|nr:hypothetical protein [Clostridia bacterium]